MAMVYEDILLVTPNGPIPVRARVLAGTLSDGSRIRAGCFRKDFEWNFTDIETGGKLFGCPDYLQTRAIRKFARMMSEITPKQLREARKRLQQRMGKV